MAYSKIYSRINWENEPSTASPINDNNLNRMDSALNTLDDRAVELSQNVETLQGYETRVAGLVAEAQTAKNQAQSSATTSTNQATLSKSYAIGGTGARSGEATDNAKYYKEQAEQAAEQAMSGTPEGYADLVAKVNSIYRQTATSYNVVGTSEGSALAHTIYGMSVQDGTPTPDSPVEIESAKADFRCTGKNLIPYPPYNDGNSKTQNGITFTVNSDGTVTVNGTATAVATYNCIIRLPSRVHKKFPNGRYHASGCPSGDSGITILFNHTVNGAAFNYLEDRGNGGTFTVNGDDFYDDGALIGVQIYISSGYTFNNVVCKPMITLADVEDSDYEHYEPYQHTDVTTDITLRAIEVASTDDYTYERDGKYYIADTIDWSEDRGYEITRRVGEVVLDGSTPIASISGNTVQIMHTAFSQMRANLNVGYSNRFAHKSSNYTTDGDANTGLSSGEFSYRKGQITTTANQRSIYLKNSDFTTTSNASTWFASNNTNIAFVLETPTTEPITSEQAQALLSLKTYDEATSISATGDIEPSVDLEYSKDRNTALALTGHNLAHKNTLKLNDINTALIELGGN